MSGQYLVDIQEERLSFFTPAGEVKALNNVTLQMKEGEVLGIVGESGSGKSTLMNILGCLDKPSLGNYFLDGEDVAAMDPNTLNKVRNQKIGFVFQSFNLISRMSALKNVEIF